jgi:putative sugar O-methyltransferase
MKTIIKQFVPPIFSTIRGKISEKRRANQYTNENFLNWWASFKHESNLGQDVIEMVDAFVASDAFKDMSIYWNYLNQKNLNQLSEFGFDNFKQTVSTNYFTWIKGISGTLGKNLIQDAKSMDISIPINQITKKHDFFDVEQSVLFNSMTALLYCYIEQKHPELLDACQESQIGNAPSIEIQGKTVSQDVLNSAIEYASIVSGRGAHPPSILEIGAGSGRDAEFFLKKSSGKYKHIICDIVPALFISQTYLSRVFPEKKSFKFREFSDFSQISEEFDSCDIGFIMPHQLPLIPDKYFDTCIAIDCLHEMKKEQINVYLRAADRLADYFYFKAWNRTMVPFDNVTHTKDEYKMPDHWEQLFKRDCYIPSDFFEAMYKISDTSRERKN